MKIIIRNGEETFEKELWLTKPIKRYELLTIIRNLYQPSKNFISENFKFAGASNIDITDNSKVLVDVDNFTIFVEKLDMRPGEV